MTGTSVPPNFTLPWNTTRTMTDVWRDEAQTDRAQKRQQTYRPRQITAQGKVAFAGYDRTEKV